MFSGSCDPNQWGEFMPEAKPITSLQQLIKLAHWMFDLARGKYYGSVELTFQNGRIVNIRQGQTHNPENILGE